MKTSVQTSDTALPLTKPAIDPDDLNLFTMAQNYADETKAREVFESWRWPGGKPVCPHCQFDESYKLTSKPGTKNKVRAGLYCCAACRKTFTATVGTVLEDSHLPISKWLMAICILCSSKKSISAIQLSRMIGVTQKTAWFMAHRIRFSLSDDGQKLSGVVEVDETFVGGKGDNKTRYQKQTPVVALIEQGGKMKTRVVASVTMKNLGQALAECVQKDAVICTDEHPGYKHPAKAFKAHHAVNHSKLEYCTEKPDGITASVNHCESFFSLLKRGVYGAWHCVSKQHLGKYSDEFAYRWNTRFLTDGARMVQLIPGLAGKRLYYRQPKLLGGKMATALVG